MADSRTSAACPLDEPRNPTDVDGIDWVAELTCQVGDFDAFGPFSDRDAYPGPE